MHKCGSLESSARREGTHPSLGEIPKLLVDQREDSLRRLPLSLCNPIQKPADLLGLRPRGIRGLGARLLGGICQSIARESEEEKEVILSRNPSRMMS
jgi:hypothetical protein